LSGKGSLSGGSLLSISSIVFAFRVDWAFAGLLKNNWTVLVCPFKYLIVCEGYIPKNWLHEGALGRYKGYVP
jgi:hypothetical protein